MKPELKKLIEFIESRAESICDDYEIKDEYICKYVKEGILNQKNPDECAVEIFDSALEFQFREEMIQKLPVDEVRFIVDNSTDCHSDIMDLLLKVRDDILSIDDIEEYVNAQNPDEYLHDALNLMMMRKDATFSKILEVCVELLHVRTDEVDQSISDIIFDDARFGVEIKNTIESEVAKIKVEYLRDEITARLHVLLKQS